MALTTQTRVADRHDAFDTGSFAASLDLQRRERDLTWKQVAEQSGVSASTLTRLNQGQNGSIDSVALLARWAGLGLDDYVGHEVAAIDSFAPPKVRAALGGDEQIPPESAQVIGEVVRVLYQHLRVRS